MSYLLQPWETIQRLASSFMSMLPRLVLGVLVAWAFIRFGRFARGIVERGAAKRSEYLTLQLALGRLAQAGIVVVGILVAATATFPSFTTGNLLSTLGVGGVAIGFAFKDIFQNFLAGILLLVTKPFSRGDQIIFKDFEGTVEDIQTRATWVKTYDGRRVVIPNSDLYLNAVTVNTAFPARRVEYDFEVPHDGKVDERKDALLRVMRSLDDVLPEPAPEVLVIGVSDPSIKLRARWWAKSRVPDALVSQDHVLMSIGRLLHSNGDHAGVAAPADSPMTTTPVHATGTEGTASRAD